MAQGAVNRPVVSMVPTVALPPGTPFTSQVTALLVVFARYVEKPLGVPSRMVRVVGDTLTETGGRTRRLFPEETMAPGSGLATRTVTEPAVVASQSTRMRSGETSCAGMEAPLICTCAFGAKPRPRISMVARPMLNDAGWIAVSVGFGYCQRISVSPQATGVEMEARTITGSGGCTEGAVYSPVSVMVPTVALPPTMALTLHVTGAQAPYWRAVNCRVVSARTAGRVGWTETETGPAWVWRTIQAAGRRTRSQWIATPRKRGACME